jgi:hypothetical protein
MDRTKLFDTFFSELKDSQSLSLYDCAAINGAEPKHENVVKDILDEMLRNKWVVDHGNGKVSLTSIGEEIVNKHGSFTKFNRWRKRQNYRNKAQKYLKNSLPYLSVIIAGFTLLHTCQVSENQNENIELLKQQIETIKSDSKADSLDDSQNPSETKAPK